MNEHARAAIVDDDVSVRRALARLLGACRIPTKTYGSAREFLDALPEDTPACLIVDLQMPEMTGLDLQLQLARRGMHIPTIVITAHHETTIEERCACAGAVAYLQKPLHESTLLSAISVATGSA